MSDRAEWLAWRREGIGASDIAAILGLSPWGSPWSVWADKMGLTPDDEGTDAMRFGNYAEGAILDWFKDETGLLPWDEQKQVIGGEPWMRVTLDALAYGKHDDYADPVAIIECKTTGEAPAKWEDGIPPHYACQATWQSIVTGIEHVKFAVMHVPFGRVSLRVYDYTPDAEDKALIYKAASEFWHGHVVTKTPPPADAHPATTDAIRRRYAITDPDDITWADDEALELVAALRAAKAHAKELESTVTELENRLKVRIGDCAELRYGDETLATWRAQDRTSVDAKALRQFHPDIAAEFSKTTTSRVLRLKTPKGD